MAAVNAGEAPAELSDSAIQALVELIREAEENIARGRELLRQAGLLLREGPA